MMGSWNEIEMLAVKAARGAGVPPAQAARFGAAVAVHLAHGRDVADISACLDKPNKINALALEVERGVEAASMSDRPVLLTRNDDSELLHSFFESLPCEVTIADAGQKGAEVAIALTRPGQRARPARVNLPPDLAARMRTLAENLLVPETEASRLGGAGAGVTDND